MLFRSLAGSGNNGVGTFDNNADINADGAVSITASTRLTTGGDIFTTNDNIFIDATTVLTQDVRIDSGPGAGDIHFTKTIDGTTANSEGLTLDGGTGGTVLVEHAIGNSVALRSMNLVDSYGATFGTLDNDYIVTDTSVRIEHTQPGRLVLFNGGVRTPQFNADAAAYHLQFGGTGTNIGTNTGADYLSAVIRNTGMVIFGDGNNDILMFRNGVHVYTASSVELFGWIYTQSAPVTLGDSDTPTNLRVHNSVIDTTAAGLFPPGDTITFGGVLEGGTAAGKIGRAHV